MATPATLPDDLLTPIRADKPAGDDLRGTADWIKFRNARPNPNVETADISDNGAWSRLLEDITVALRKKSKDLQLAIWLTEANIRLHGYAGLRDSLSVVRGLLVQFWDSGLFPSVEDGDIETRLGPLQWFNDKLTDLIREIPITHRNDGGPDYSYAHFVESRKPKSWGAVTADQFEEASRLTDVAHFAGLAEDCRLAREEFNQLEAVTNAKFSTDLISFSQSKEAFEECQLFLDKLVAQRTPKTTAGVGSVVDPASGPASNGGGALEFGFGGAPSDGSWDEAERLVRTGKISEGLSEMTRLAATASNGRVRFHRKLLLADICLSTKRDALAKSILEELSELVDKHHLEEWEAPQVTGAVWSRLYRCYKNEQAGIADADKAALLFLKLCRLDPWQALACSDGK